MGCFVSYMLRAPASIQHRPTRLAVGLLVTLSSNSCPICPSITLRMCAVSRNKNGRFSTFRSLITCPSAPTLTRARAIIDATGNPQFRRFLDFLSRFIIPRASVRIAR